MSDQSTVELRATFGLHRRNPTKLRSIVRYWELSSWEPDKRSQADNEDKDCTNCQRHGESCLLNTHTS